MQQIVPKKATKHWYYSEGNESIDTVEKCTKILTYKDATNVFDDQLFVINKYCLDIFYLVPYIEILLMQNKRLYIPEIQKTIDLRDLQRLAKKVWCYNKKHEHNRMRNLYMPAMIAFIFKEALRIPQPSAVFIQLWLLSDDTHFAEAFVQFMHTHAFVYRVTLYSDINHEKIVAYWSEKTQPKDRDLYGVERTRLYEFAYYTALQRLSDKNLLLQFYVIVPLQFQIEHLNVNVYGIRNYLHKIKDQSHITKQLYDVFNVESYVFGKEQHTNTEKRNTYVTFEVPYDASMCRHETLKTIAKKHSSISL